MSTEIQIVEKQTILGKVVNAYGCFRNPLFPAKDVAEWIEYRKTPNGAYDVFNLLKSIDEDEKLVRTLLVSGQNRNEPKQKYVEKGFFELKEKWIERSNHGDFAVIKVLVTQCGLDFIAKLFGVISSEKQTANIQ